MSTACGASWRRSRSALAIAAGPGHSSTSHWGSLSSALLNGSTFVLVAVTVREQLQRPRHLVIDLQAVAIGIGEMDAALADMIGGTLDLDAVLEQVGVGSAQMPRELLTWLDAC
jgi:hypothetical protein